MYRTKQHVDKHVLSILHRLRDEKDRQSRGYQIAKLYYEVNEYELSKRYLLGYLTVKENHAAPHKLLGQVHEALADYSKAVTAYKRSLELDPNQKQLVLKICELYTKLDIDPERAKYWAERAEKLFPCHESILNLREKMYSNSKQNGNMEELEHLLSTELNKNPHDVKMRERLLRLYLDMGQVNRAYTHAMDVEKKAPHPQSDVWYKCLLDVLQVYQQECGKEVNGLFHKQLLNVYNYYLHIVMQTATAAECAEILYKFDQVLYHCANIDQGDTEWVCIHTEMCAQFFYHAATLLLKRALQDQQGWSRITPMAGVLYLYSAATCGPNLQTPWYAKATKDVKSMYNRLHGAAHLRLGQSGHMLKHLQDADGVEWCNKVISDFSSSQGREKMYAALFPLRHMKDGKISSYLMKNDYMNTLKPAIPALNARKNVDTVMYQYVPDNLHTLVWTAMQYFTVDEKLQPDYNMKIFQDLLYTCQTIENALPETLSQLDTESFLYACVYCAVHNAADLRMTSAASDCRPVILPAVLTKPLCTNEQQKWWKAAYSLYKNTAKESLGHMRLELRRGLEEVRLTDSSTIMSVPLLTNLARTFTERALVSKNENAIDKYHALQERAVHYWAVTVKQIERKGSVSGHVNQKKKSCLFDNGSMNQLTRSEKSSILDEGLLIIADHHMARNEYEEALDKYARVQIAEAAFKQAQIYHILSDTAADPSSDNDKQKMLLMKARDALYNALDRIQGHAGHQLAPMITKELDTIESKLSDLEVEDTTDSPMSKGLMSPASYSVTPLRTPGSKFTSGHGPTSYSTPNRMGNTSAQELSFLSSPHVRPSPERLDAQVRSLAFTQDIMVRQVMERNEQFMEQSAQVMDEVKQNRQLIKDMQAKMLAFENTQTTLVSLVKSNHEATLSLVKNNHETALAAIATRPAPPPPEKSKVDTDSLQSDVAQTQAEVAQVMSSLSALTAMVQQPQTNMPHLMAAAGATPYGMEQPRTPAPQPRGPGMSSYMMGVPQPGMQGMPLYSGYRQEYDYINQFQQQAYAAAAQQQQQQQQAQPQSMYPHLQQGLTGYISPNTQPTYRMPFRATTPQDFQCTGEEGSSESEETAAVNSYLATNNTNDNWPFDNQKPSGFGSNPSGATTQLFTAQPATPAASLFPQAEKITPSFLTGVNNTNDSANTSGTSFPITFKTLPCAEGSKITTTLDGKSPAKIAEENQNQEEGDDYGDDSYQGPDFEPIIPLPDEIEVVTGEESESVLFDNRCKLYRFVEKQWKERGLGNIKILFSDEKQQARILMRREQVFKVCANHNINESMSVKINQDKPTTLTWQCMDFTDGEAQLENLCARFKTEELAKEFCDQFNVAKEKVSSGGSKEKKSIVKPTGNTTEGTKTLAEKFKAKSGTWDCDVCTINNPADIVTCQACNTLKPGAEPPKEEKKEPAVATSFGAGGGLSFGAQASFSTFSFGGSKTSTTDKPDTTSSGKATFSFSTPAKDNGQYSAETPFSDALKNISQKQSPEVSSTTTTEKPAMAFSSPNTSTYAGFTFKNKPDISETKAELPAEKAKEADKDSKATSKANPFAKFTFTPSKSDNSATIPTASGGIFNTPNKTGAGLFGTPSTCATTASALFGTPSTATTASSGILGTSTGLFGTPNTTTTSKGLFGTPSTTASTTGGIFGTATPSASLFATDKSTPSFDGLADVSNKDGIFSAKPGSTQSFKPGGEIFKATDKSPKKPEHDGNVDEAEHNTSEYEPDVDFKPVIPLPGLVDVKTGEEDEVKLFGERAKLYRMDTESKTWKERGVGELKLLKHKESGRVRILMRREQVLKLCANHKITEDMTLQRLASSNVAWCWFAQDYAEGELNNEQLAAKFKTPELAQMFKDIFEEAQRNLATTPEKPKSKDVVAPKSETSSGFGDKFKPKAGEWSCDMCYVLNKADCDQCVSCESVRPGATPKPKADILPTKSSSAVSFGKEGGFSISSLSTNNGATKSESFNFSSFGTKPDSKPATEASSSTFSFTPTKPATDNVPSNVPSKPFTFSTSSKFSFSTPTKEVAPSPKSPTSPEYYQSNEEDEPQIDFKPVIDLPDKIDVVTGEEDELVLYSHRSKLYRFVDGAWKERGIGDLKILQHKQTFRVRLLMRREQVLKLCLNHYVTEDIELKPMLNSDDKTWIWHAEDFSESESKHEQLAAKFKNAEIAAKFKEAFIDAQNVAGKKLGNPLDAESKAKSDSISSTQNQASVFTSTSVTTTPQTSTGFSFKSPSVFGGASSTGPSPSVFGGAQSNSKTSVFGGASSTGTSPSIFGGTQSNSNTPSVFGGASSTGTSPSIFGGAQSSLKSPSVFGGSSQTTSSTTLTFDTSSTNEDKASPLPRTGGSLLEKLLVNPESESMIPSVVSSLVCEDGDGDDVIYLSQDTPTEEQRALAAKYQLPETFYLYENKPNCKGCVGCEDWESRKDAILAQRKKVQEEAAKPKPGKEETTTVNAPADSTCTMFQSSAGSATFSSLLTDNANAAWAKPTEGFSWAGQGQGIFTKSSPHKTDGNSGDEDNVESEPNVHFEPVVPLPDLVETKTGEEGEDVIYSHRCKLYRYTNDQWKERGLGDIKLLRQPQTGSVRILMRREQVHKVCCNHAITKDMQLQPMHTSETSWCWFAVDYTEYEPTNEQFAVKFKNQEIAVEFKEKFEECQQMLNTSVPADESSVNEAEYNVEHVVESDYDEEDDQYYDEDGDDGEENGDGSYDYDAEALDEELKPFFDKRATLQYLTEDNTWANRGMGDLKIEYNDDVMGFCVRMLNNKDEFICNHIICETSTAHSDEQHKSCEWSAQDYSTDEPVRRTFRALFSSSNTVVEFHRIFMEGQGVAAESGIQEAQQQTREILVPEIASSPQ